MISFSSFLQVAVVCFLLSLTAIEYDFISIPGARTRSDEATVASATLARQVVFTGTTEPSPRSVRNTTNDTVHAPNMTIEQTSGDVPNLLPDVDPFRTTPAPPKPTQLPKPKSRHINIGSVYDCGNTTYTQGARDGLELVPSAPSLLYYRKRPREYTVPDIRVACLLSGFLRDYRRMLVHCPNIHGSGACKRGVFAKMYGSQEEYVLSPLDCDVFISSWDIMGKGRYDVKSYNMEDTVEHGKVCEAYGDRLTGLHMQHYAAYEPIWKRMSPVRRNFTEAYPIDRGHIPTGELWAHKMLPSSRFRVNDYSQSYKHWVLVKMADRAPVKYDIYFRFRSDMRATQSFIPGSLRRVKFEPEPTFEFRMMKDRKVEENIVHYVHPGRIHAACPDYSDLGYMGTPNTIRTLAKVWTEKCNGPALTEEQAAHYTKDEADYNRVLWTYIFELGWSVDLGGRYFVISRRYGEVKKQSK